MRIRCISPHAGIQSFSDWIPIFLELLTYYFFNVLFGLRIISFPQAKINIHKHFNNFAIKGDASALKLSLIISLLHEPYILVPKFVYIQGVLNLRIPYSLFLMCRGGFILGMHKEFWCAEAIIVHVPVECISTLNRANFLLWAMISVP